MRTWAILAGASSRSAWYGAAFPALVLNYFGQGAYILTHPASTENPFFAMAPARLARACLTGLSIRRRSSPARRSSPGPIRSPARRSSSATFPRLKINYTNAEQSGQIYVPFVNTLLAIGCILTAALFGSSGPSGLRLRHRGDGHDGDHHHRLLFCRPPQLALALLWTDRASVRACFW